MPTCKRAVEAAAAATDLAGAALRTPVGPARSDLELHVVAEAREAIAGLRAIASGASASSYQGAAAFVETLQSLETHVRTGVAYEDDYAAAVRALESVDSALACPDRASVRTAAGRLSPEAVQVVVRESFARFRDCYEKALAKTPDLHGRIAVKFVIDRGGAVATAADDRSDLPDPAVVACVVREFGSLQFPRPRGGMLTVFYPIQFSPED
jgi:hypothetical protein